MMENLFKDYLSPPYNSKNFYQAIRTLSLPLGIRDEKELIHNMTKKQKKRLNNSIKEIGKVMSEAWHENPVNK
jgi:hypothetical protein